LNKESPRSHIVSIQTEVRDAAAVRNACKRLQLPQPTMGKHRLFSGEVEGLAVQLPGWKYPVVAQLDTGKLHYDNYNGRWGQQEYFDRFVQVYAVEKAKIDVHDQSSPTHSTYVSAHGRGIPRPVDTGPRGPPRRNRQSMQPHCPDRPNRPRPIEARRSGQNQIGCLMPGANIEADGLAQPSVRRCIGR